MWINGHRDGPECHDTEDILGALCTVETANLRKMSHESSQIFIRQHLNPKVDIHADATSPSKRDEQT